MQSYRNSIFYFRLFADIVLLNAAYLSAALLVEQIKGVNFTPESLYILIILNFVWYFTARGLNLYDEFHTRAFGIEAAAIIKGVIVQFLALVVLLFVFREMSLSRNFVVWYSLFLTGGLIAGRALIRKVLKMLRRRGRSMRHLLIIGARDTGMEFNEVLLGNPHFGYNVLGFVDDHPQQKLNGKYLGKLEDLTTILKSQRVDDVVVALPANSKENIREIIKTCDNHLTRVKILPDYYPLLTDNFSISRFNKFPLISVREIDLDEVHYRILKRSFDIFFSLCMFLFVFSWLWPLIALGVKLSSPGPVFFKQERWGRNNERIIFYKFRSMVPDSKDVDENGKYKQAVKNDPRITKFGAFLRRMNLDELPQFWNVLKGEMSIVGPRPHPTPLNLESRNVVEHYMLRHLVKPGITGWAQANGYRGPTQDIERMKKRVEYDLWYIENWNFWLDIQIIVLTVYNMIKGDPNAC